MADHFGNPYYAHYEANAKSYESINNFKKDITQQLLKQCPSIKADSIILDNACGPGTVTGEIHKLLPPSNIPQIHAVDFSPRMVDELRHKAEFEKWTNVNAAVMDAENLTFEDDKFSHSITNFGIFLFPDPVKAAAGIYRTLQAGGVAVVTSWSRLGWLDLLQRVQRNIRPHATPWAGPSAAWMGTDKLREVMLEGGFQPEKLKIIFLRTMLSGEQMELYLWAMKPAWVIRAVMGWDDVDKKEFEKQFSAALEGLKTNGTEIELVTSVAIAEK